MTPAQYPMLGAPSAKAHRDGLEQIAIFLQLLDGSFNLKKGKIPQSGDMTDGVPGGSQVLFFLISPNYSIGEWRYHLQILEGD